MDYYVFERNILFWFVFIYLHYNKTAQKEVLLKNGSLMKVESIAECSTCMKR